MRPIACSDLIWEVQRERERERERERAEQKMAMPRKLCFRNP